MKRQTLLSEQLGTTDGSSGNTASELKPPLPRQKAHRGSAFKSRDAQDAHWQPADIWELPGDGTGRDEQTREQRACLFAAGR